MQTVKVFDIQGYFNTSEDANFALSSAVFKIFHSFGVLKFSSSRLSFRAELKIDFYFLFPVARNFGKSTQYYFSKTTKRIVKKLDSKWEKNAGNRFSYKMS